MSEFAELFQYQFFINALLASVLTAISCGIIGSYVVTKRIVFVSGGITHASFGGIGLAYYLGLNPISGAFVFALLTGLGIESFTKKGSIRNDSVIAMLWSLGMAIGIIFIYLTPGYAPNLMSYLFGNILTIKNIDLIMLAGLSLIIILYFFINYRKILFISFDEDFASTRQVRVNLINHILMILVSLTIVLNIKTVGIILLISLLTVPQNTANLFTKDFKMIMIYSIVIAFIGSLSGLILSYYLDIPSGATIIFNLIIFYLLARLIKVFSLKKKRISKSI